MIVADDDAEDEGPLSRSHTLVTARQRVSHGNMRDGNETFRSWSSDTHLEQQQHIEEVISNEQRGGIVLSAGTTGSDTQLGVLEEHDRVRVQYV